MAPSDERPKNCPFPNDDENPFIAFRRFADEAMSSMLQSFIGLPSSFNSPDPNERWIPFDEQARRRTMESWGATTEKGSNNRDTQPTRQTDEATEQAGNTTHPLYWGLAPPERPYAPREFPFGHFHPRDPLDNKFFSHENLHQPMCEWVARYLTSSPYSPQNLESKPEMARFGSAWRRAFEDLLDAQYGKKLKSIDERRRTFGGESGLDWALAISRRPELCECENSDMNGSVFEAPQRRENAGLTELDMYERWYQEEKKRENALEKAVAAELSKHVGKSEGGQGLGIVSTLTTTERVTMPDGTTNTKVVLKKRFADGREESSETVHSTQGKQENKSIADAVQAFGSSGKDNEKSKDKKGWFWK